MRVSLVMLALLLPALFSSLLAVSSVGEGRSAKTIPSQVNTAEVLASLVSEWEQGAYELADDDIDDYTLLSRLMGSLSNGSMFIEGRLAKLVYVSLYNMHQFAVHGKVKGALKLIVKKLSHAISPKLKLH